VLGTQQFEDGFVKLDGDDFYVIRDYHRLDPFLMNVVSASDLWMFVSSQGGLTAGRVNAQNSLFSYETVDRLHDAHHYAGPITSLQIAGENEADTVTWEPFLQSPDGTTRNLYKSLPGNEIVFEEHLHRCGLTFRYRWTSADDLGLVRTVTLINESTETIRFDVLDGLRNLLPWGISLPLQQQFSCLTDAYKRSEVDADTNIGIFSLTAGIVDGTYPTEVLRSNVVWHVGLENATVCLSQQALSSYRQRTPVVPEHLLTGRRGNYFLVNRQLELEAGDQLRWHVVADVGLGHVELAALRNKLLAGAITSQSIDDSVSAATQELQACVAASDGLQHTHDLVTTAHHFSNVLFNNMRGGVFVDEQAVNAVDVADFMQSRNREVFQRHRQQLSNGAPLAAVRAAAKTTDDVDLKRLIDEFLPLTFSRRHGDPSRPWNQFSIELKKDDGTRALRYQGNWRDIFQNWEALCVSFPMYLENVIKKFVNGSTVDGFNPYRVTNAGMEWEIPEPEDAWANIGYWGDHQIVYLLKLLEALEDRQPGRIQELLGSPEFVYLNVPYRLKPYAEIVRNIRETVNFDHELDQVIAARCASLGEDGKLLPGGSNGTIVHANLLEKLLVPMLSKLSNLVVGGGIWMNTQRPEWNDANNALVGNGLSVVTLAYLLRYLKFLSKSLAPCEGSYEISAEIALWLRATMTVLDRHRAVLAADEVSEQERRRILDALGQIFTEYRAQVYQHGLSETEPVAVAEIIAICDLASQYADHTLRLNLREDHLYHAYNLADFSHDGHLQVRHLYEMLEGQVAVLSSGTLTAAEAANLLEEMYRSRLYRDDQHTFMLYPDRELSDFLDKNVIPEADVKSNPLLCQLLAEKDTSIIEQDSLGAYRFHADFQHSLDLEAALLRLKKNSQWEPLVVAHRRETVELFDHVFQHHAYTGRSGTFYGYEGLGCIYWHMVAKLLLTVQENYFAAIESDSAAADQLRELYYKVRSGLGFSKTPMQFGAFPIDAYSHTPKHTGAQQPGMTGQVKEEVLTRFGELGLRVQQGCLKFQPSLLRLDEFIIEPSSFEYFDRSGRPARLDLPTAALAFTYCQVPVVYQLTDGDESIHVTYEDGSDYSTPSLILDEQQTQAVMTRSSGVTQVHVRLRPDRLYAAQG
jgi:hypothetical protein